MTTWPRVYLTQPIARRPLERLREAAEVKVNENPLHIVAQGEGPHHIGMWASDGRERAKGLQGRGLRPEIVHYSVGG